MNVTEYDRSLKNFSIQRPAQKISIGIIHFKDNRRDGISLLGNTGIEKISITQMALKLTEEILKKKFRVCTGCNYTIS